MKQFNESSLEKAIIELFENVGYTYQKADEIHRQETDVILSDDLENYIRNKYAYINLTENEISTILDRLIKCGSNTKFYENSKETYYLVTRGFDLKREDNSLNSVHIDYIDFDNASNNSFKVVNQYKVKGSRESRIPDLIVFINGIPISIWEFKSAAKENKTIKDAWEQINIRYRRAIDNLLQYCFLSVISDGANTKLGTIMTDYEFYYAWNRVNETGDEDTNISGIKSLEKMINGAFTPERIIEILNGFVFYPETTDENACPIVCRYPQFFGAKLMAKNIVEHIDAGDGKGGTYFGAMGCGKTYTMLFASYLLKKQYADKTKNPTILLIEDTDDLNVQTINVFKAANKYLQDDDVRSFESRKDLKNTLKPGGKEKEGGGVYVTTIQKFCADTGKLSDRSNIICIADEAHRTQLNLEEKKIYTSENEIITTKGFGKILRDSLPNAVYCGFTGTPIEETISVFGGIVDRYTMAESVNDGITVDITYISKRANLNLNNEVLKEIDDYYDQCADEGASDDQIAASKSAMANISAIYSNPEVLRQLAEDIVKHYEKMCSEKPEVVQKAMIVCADRTLAYNIYKEIKKIREDWTIKKKVEDESKYTKYELDVLPEIEKINLVMTRESNDPKEMYDLAGSREYRKNLATQFKDEKTNFKIAIVSDMWITGFDVKPLKALYLIKPVKTHQLIQTISRVNRVWPGKDNGIVIDYINIKDKLDEALAMYSNPDKDFKVYDVSTVANFFREQLKKIENQLSGFDSSKFFNDNSSDLDRLRCLSDAVDYVQRAKAAEDEFMDSVLLLKKTYDVAIYSADLTDKEIEEANYYMAIRSIIYKQTKGDAPDTEIMNNHVEKMINDAIGCTGLTKVFEEEKVVDLFDDENINAIKLIHDVPTKVNALIKIIEKALSSYEHINRTKQRQFSEMLEKIIEEYNKRGEEKTLDASKTIVKETINKLYDLKEAIEKDNKEKNDLGVSEEIKAYYDILLDARRRYGLDLSDETCMKIAKGIEKIFEEETKFTDWTTRSDIKNSINKKITLLLSENNFALKYKDPIFEEIFEQAKNLTKYY